MSQVVTATSSDSVESSPPEMPIFKGVPLGSCSIRLASPAHWMPKISAQRRCNSGPDGTNGVPGTSRCSPSIPGDRANLDAAEGAERREAVVEAGHHPAVGAQPGDVHVPGDGVRVAADRMAVADPGRLRQQHAVLGDQAMAAEDDVRRGLGRPAAGHRIRRDAPARLADHQVGAVPALADRLVARREVHEHRRPGHGLERAGGHGHPEVLADLDADDQAPLPAFPARALRLEQEIDAERHDPAAQLDLRRLLADRRAEPPALVELLVIGQELLGHDAQHRAVGDRHGAVEQAVADRDRRADEDDLPAPRRRISDPADGRGRGIQQPRLAEQVGAGVSGDAEFRKHDDVAIGAGPEHPDDLIGVGRRVGDRGPDRDAGDAGEAIRIHDSVSLDRPGSARRAVFPGGSAAGMSGRPIDRARTSRVEQVTFLRG